jgi:hypothetical protein
MLPSSENLNALARVLKVPVDYFFKTTTIRLEIIYLALYPYCGKWLE